MGLGQSCIEVLFKRPPNPTLPFPGNHSPCVDINTTIAMTAEMTATTVTGCDLQVFTFPRSCRPGTPATSAAASSYHGSICTYSINPVDPGMFSLRVPEIGGFRDSKLDERPEKFSFRDGRGYPLIPPKPSWSPPERRSAKPRTLKCQCATS